MFEKSVKHRANDASNDGHRPPLLGPIRKRRFGRHAKTAAGNGSNPIRLLKCHVRREKGPTRGPRGPSVAGRGAHVSPRSNFSGGQTEKIEVPFEPPETVSVPQLTFTFW